jgi:hypothetical protein
LPALFTAASIFILTEPGGETHSLELLHKGMGGGVEHSLKNFFTPDKSLYNALVHVGSISTVPFLLGLKYMGPVYMCMQN